MHFISDQSKLLFNFSNDYKLWYMKWLAFVVPYRYFCIMHSCSFWFAWHKAKQRWKSGVIILHYSFWIIWQFESRGTKLNYTLPDYLRESWKDFGSIKNRFLKLYWAFRQWVSSITSHHSLIYNVDIGINIVWWLSALYINALFKDKKILSINAISTKSSSRLL